MGQAIDNVMAYRILKMLVTPFKETDAYRLGIIDDNGNVLIKASKLKTQEQKNAYNYLTRLVFNLKRMLAKLPGGDNRIKNMVAALAMIKEHSEYGVDISEHRLKKMVDAQNDGVVFVEEVLMVERYLQQEDAPVNVTGPMVSTDIPVKRLKLVKRKKQNVIS